jgi:hypothetical protein
MNTSRLEQGHHYRLEQGRHLVLLRHLGQDWGPSQLGRSEHLSVIWDLIIPE